jgi:electron transfer flavoprotein beta subunit
MTIGVCVKWVTPTPGDDDRFAGISPADAAALEWALRVGEASGDDVLVVSHGPLAAETALREALASGADRAVRIDATAGADSLHTAVALAAVLSECRIVWCGDYSLDRGSGSVPAYLAAELHAVQALGLVDIAVRDDGGLDLVRRLDGGRREVLSIEATPDEPAVLSVEGSTARIRRASLRSTLAAQSARIDVVPGASTTETVPPALRPFRPRARVLPAPAGSAALDRLRVLTDAGSAGATRGETVELDPAAAADRILATLVEWGELEN